MMMLPRKDKEDSRVLQVLHFQVLQPQDLRVDWIMNGSLETVYCEFIAIGFVTFHYFLHYVETQQEVASQIYS